VIDALWRDGMAYAVGTLLSRGIALLLLPLLTRVLPPADYGALDLIVTCGVLVNLVVPLEIAQALARNWGECVNDHARRRLAGTAWTFTLVGYGAFAVVGLIGAGPIAAGLLGQAHYANAVRAGTIAIALNGLFYVLQNQLRFDLRARAYAALGIAYALINLLLVWLLAWTLRKGLEGVLWAQAIAAAAAVAASLVLLHRSLPIGLAREELARMLRFSLPLVPAGIAVFGSFYANRLVLNALAPLHDVGVFGVANRVAGLATLVLIGVQGALTPLVYAHHQERETPAVLARLLEAFAAIALTVCLGYALFGEQLVLLLATADYAMAAPLLSWLAMAALLAQMYIFAPGVAIAKKTHWQLLITLASAMSGLGLSALLIPRWGLWGATFAAFAASVIYFAAWLVASQRLYPLPLRARALVLASLFFVMMVLLASEAAAWVKSGAGLWLLKALVLLVFAAGMVALGLLRPRSLRPEVAARV
jgi:O-antigen/teichoic acid export membrane protein